MSEELPGLKQFDLSGRVAIITGGSKGLGLAMGAGLASAGCNLVLVSRHLEEGETAAASIRKEYPVDIIALAADVTNPHRMERMAQETIDRHGRIDILINSAGINIRGGMEELSYEDFQKVMQVNVDGTWLASKAVIPHMKKAGSGRIINMASTLGLVGLANRTPYTSSKGAIVQMTRALGLELALRSYQCKRHLPRPISY